MPGDTGARGFDHAFRPDSTAFWLGFGSPVCSQLRSKWFLRTFLPSGAPLCEFQRA